MAIARTWSDAREEVAAREEAALCMAALEAMEEARRTCFEVVVLEGVAVQKAGIEIERRTDGRVKMTWRAVARVAQEVREELRRARGTSEG